MKRLVVLVIGAALAVACVGGRGAVPRPGPSPTTEETLPPPDEYGGIAPTRTAAATVERIVAVPKGVADCGYFVETAGYPTTVAPRLDFADCLIAAYESGDRARAAVSARNNRGGIVVAVFGVHQAGVLEVAAYRVGPDGAVDLEESTCSPPVEDIWWLNADGSVRDAEHEALCA